MAELVEIRTPERNPASMLAAAAGSARFFALLRQFGVLGGIAAAVALGTWVVLWTQTPSYSLLYGNLSDRDITQVMDALQASNIRYRVDHSSGAVLVPSAEVHEARMKLATAGLPNSSSMGFEVLQEQSSFGTSQFMETMRYQHALEAELARTVGQLTGVRSARVHLGMPKQTAFLRDRKQPSASVLLDLYPGRTLEKGQVAAISHLVSAAVPNLPLSGVTVVDQRGRLLSEDDPGNGLALTERQLEFTRSIEDRHARAITALLERIAGPDAVHVQVAADVDFTVSEQTSETFNPDLATVRSEQKIEERRIGAGTLGVPGALSNQPPGAGQAPEVANAGADAGADGGAGAGDATGTARTPETSRSQQVRNFEVDRTINHTTSPVGQLRRLSVAVLVKNRTQTDDAGVTTSQPWSAEEIANFEGLARRAVGFDEARGDSLSVTAADLVGPQAVEPLPEVPLWEQPWFWDVARQLGGASFALLVLLTVLRPAVKSLTAKPEKSEADEASGLAQIAGEEAGVTILRLPDGRSVTVDLSNLDSGATRVVGMPRSESTELVVAGQASDGTAEGSGEGDDANALVHLDELERDLHKVREMVITDPKLAALIMRRWVEAGE
jgi:flagellar M-ring protein FliF